MNYPTYLYLKLVKNVVENFAVSIIISKFAHIYINL